MNVKTSPKIKSIKTAKPRANGRLKKAESRSSNDAIQRLLKHANELPEEVWAGVPDDASKQYEHYLYGTPRVPD
jgi:hypothetical protein